MREQQPLPRLNSALQRLRFGCGAALQECEGGRARGAARRNVSLPARGTKKKEGLCPESVTRPATTWLRCAAHPPGPAGAGSAQRQAIAESGVRNARVYSECCGHAKFAAAAAFPCLALLKSSSPKFVTNTKSARNESDFAPAFETRPLQQTIRSPQTGRIAKHAFKGGHSSHGSRRRPFVCCLQQTEFTAPFEY
jgi:hypothetical protein